MKRTLLIDADIVNYKFASATEEVYYFDGKDQPPAVHHDTKEACDAAEAYIEDLRSKLGAAHVVICLTDRGNEFRKDFWPAYKGNRKGRKPADLFNVEAHLASKYETYKRPRLEADDCMGILSTHPSLIPGERIIVSEDKDMASVPGLLFNPAKDDEPRRISKLAANRMHMVQTITGDQVDNYPGAPFVGPKSPEVAAVMEEKTVEGMWRHVLAAFERGWKRADPEAPPEVARQMAVIMARCARILRSSDWNFSQKKPILWTPFFPGQGSYPA